MFRLAALAHVLTWLVLASAALAQEATPGLPGYEDVVRYVITHTNIYVQIVMTAGTFVLHRMRRIPASLAIWGPMGVGAFLGVLYAVAAAPTVGPGAAGIAQLGIAIVEGVLINGFGSLLIGRGVSLALDKLGWWPNTATEAPPPQE